MPFATLPSESLLMTSGSRLRKSARSPKVTDPPCRGGPDGPAWPPPPPPPQAAITSRTVAVRIPSDRLRISPLSPSFLAAGWRQLTLGKEHARGGIYLPPTRRLDPRFSPYHGGELASGRGRSSARGRSAKRRISVQ